MTANIEFLKAGGERQVARPVISVLSHPECRDRAATWRRHAAGDQASRTWQMSRDDPGT
jgi:hypothetical protein